MLAPPPPVEIIQKTAGRGTTKEPTTLCLESIRDLLGQQRTPASIQVSVAHLGAINDGKLAQRYAICDVEVGSKVDLLATVAHRYRFRGPAKRGEK